MGRRELGGSPEGPGAAEGSTPVVPGGSSSGASCVPGSQALGPHFSALSTVRYRVSCVWFGHRVVSVGVVGQVSLQKVLVLSTPLPVSPAPSLSLWRECPPPNGHLSSPRPS